MEHLRAHYGLTLRPLPFTSLTWYRVRDIGYLKRQAARAIHASADRLCDDGDFEEAIEEYERIVRRFPEYDRLEEVKKSLKAAKESAR